jgi:L-lactate dehydrogenase (cytochrome)
MDLANLSHRVRKGRSHKTAHFQYVQSQFDSTVTWDDAAWMINEWGGPFAIKGVLTANDARRAVEIGASAIIVSNHGGRQLDGLPASIDALPEIVNATGDRAEIILDGGIRRGAHVLKALALGATACMIGRPYLFGSPPAKKQALHEFSKSSKRKSNGIWHYWPVAVLAI